MKIRTIGVVLIIGIVLTNAPIWAGPIGVEKLSPAEKSLVLSVLEQKEKRIGQEIPEPPKGVALGRYMAKRAEIRRLINRIETGQPVSPDEIDQEFWPTNP
jgi:hypothetical protein